MSWELLESGEPHTVTIPGVKNLNESDKSKPGLGRWAAGNCVWGAGGLVVFVGQETNAEFL